MKTLLSVRTEASHIYDDSMGGIPLKAATTISAAESENTVRIKKGCLEPAPLPGFKDISSFTIEATVNPASLPRKQQTVAESDSPHVALYIDKDGYLNGGVKLKEEGWVSIKSSKKLVAGKAQNVTFSRNSRGRMTLELDSKLVARDTRAGALADPGSKNLKIGTAADGKTHQFVGEIGNIRVREGVFRASHMRKRIAECKKLEKKLKAKIKAGPAVFVNPSLDESERQLLTIKNIMQAAGVDSLSDLSTLQVTVPTTMSRGKILVAPKVSDITSVNWGKLATDFKTLDSAAKKSFLAKYMTNRNSAAVIRDAKNEPTTVAPGVMADSSVTADVAATRTLAPDVAATRTLSPDVAATPTLAPDLAASRTLTPDLAVRHTLTADVAAIPGERFTGRIDSLGTADRTGLRIPRDVIAVNPTVEALRSKNLLSENINVKKAELTVYDKNRLLDNLESKRPQHWLKLTPSVQMLSLQTLPVNSSVIIAGTLDLTNTRLIVEPDVEKLYIIAEKVICRSNAKITWRKPGGSTPPRLDDAGLNGNNGIGQKPGTRDGRDGGNGSSGSGGIGGADGYAAPSIEMWVKDLTNIPSIDLNGENGIRGGKGQKGGNGGKGANGLNGKYRWVWTPFGNIEWCDTAPGDGGDGGNGGRGGNGGKGGRGGDGGWISIAVLEGTLGATVTAGQFQWKNQGGQRGRGGAGGSGGSGGQRGSRGYTSHCDQASHGRSGSRGQPGTAGLDGNNLGADGVDEFKEFTEDAWNAMLTRPWITDIDPHEVFPGNTITIRGSRFANNDRVIIDGVGTYVPVINPDESLTITVPQTIAGGNKSVYVRRAHDNTESNQIPIWIKPRLDSLPASLNPSADIVITGRAFLANASVLINGNAIPGTVNAAGTQIQFTMPGTGGAGSAGGNVTVAVRNPDGFESNSRTAHMPRILEIPFEFGVHNLPFANFTDGVPSWSTYEDTFGTAEVWHELLDPIFGHPILTGAYYFFYEHFLKGTANGGLATGFCTSLASLVADKMWQGLTDANSTTKGSVHKWLTGVHGKLLSRESLIRFHDQSRQGLARVELTARAIERTFMTGCDRNVAPLLFFIPSGAIWDSGYIDSLGSSHCLMPYKFEYPEGHGGPVLSGDGSTTVSSLDGVRLYCWDCNHPSNTTSHLEFRDVGGVLHYSYFPDGTLQFDSTQDITLGICSNGDYLLADHDLPFSGPFGLTSFVIDFLLSPADLEITNENGLRVGNFNNQIFSEISDSHPFYLLNGAYLLPTGQNYTRKIIGNGTGNYTFNTLMPDGTTLKLEEVPTKLGQSDVLIVNDDVSQVRFTPHEEKQFNVTVSKMVGNQVRALAISGVGGGPGTDIDITTAPDLSLFRLGNRSISRNVEIKAFSIDKTSNSPVNKKTTMTLPGNHDLVVNVSDWNNVDLDAETVAF